ncbi:hypothetical protein PVK06_002299 [Gossypium arboreum]|uniref:DUF7745 domain-containing protein n=1 Tax=Gossypium arboreum TaxID=29729 RepID=A0ABR0R487_GOSAR|nr:hypothetical protein PVK06_002299 [Gossypium arboreum]
MENEFLDKVEDNTVVRMWSEKMQLEKGDSLAEGYTSELWDFTHISVTQNEFQELRDIWSCWDGETKQLFYQNYGDLPYFVDVKWTSTCSELWLSFGTLHIVVSLLGRWTCLRDLIVAHLDIKKKVDIFALSIYGLVVFPRALRYIDKVVADLFDRLDKRVTLVLAVLAETFRSLSACQRVGEGRFVGCVLLVWFHGHFWKVDKVSYRVFSEDYSPLKEVAAIPIRDDISGERWMTILQNLQEEDVEWRAPWIVPDEILYRCGSFDWIPLPRTWGVVGYAPLLVLRQYKSRQFIPITYGLAQSEFSYSGNNYKKKDFEKKNSELGKKIEQLKEEKMHLRLDAVVQKLEAEKLRKGKRKVEEDLDSLKTNYKKLCMSMRTTGLGKISK